MDPDYRRVYRDLYTRHWWWRAREGAVLDALHRRFNSSRGLRILDVGCGDGLLFDRLKEFGEVQGIESAADVVDPHGPHRAKIAVAPFDESFRPGQRFSLILMLDVLEHLDHPVEALRHARSLLESDGLLLITVPAFPLLWTNHDVLNQHRVRFTKSTFLSIASQAGIHVLYARYFFFSLAFAKLLARGKEAVLPSRPEVPRVPAPWLNRLLERISRAENRIAFSLPLPFGSSLLILAAPRSEDIAAH